MALGALLDMLCSRKSQADMRRYFGAACCVPATLKLLLNSCVVDEGYVRRARIDSPIVMISHSAV